MNKQTVRTVTGVAILGIGVLTLLNSLDIVSVGDVLHDWWPMAVIAAGVLIFANHPRDFVWPLIIVMAGTLLQLRELDIINTNPWHLFWPLVIIAVGISILINRSPSHKTTGADDVTVFLAGSSTKNNAADYKGSKITAILGGADIDLRGATIKDEATLTISTILGGIDIKVPEGWRVRSKIRPVAGAIEIKTKNAGQDAPVLTLVGDVVLGGVEVKH